MDVIGIDAIQAQHIDNNDAIPWMVVLHTSNLFVSWNEVATSTGP